MQDHEKTKDQLIDELNKRSRKVSELDQVVNDLKRKTEEQALLLNTIDTQIWYLTDPETHGSVNQARADFLGKQREEIEGKRLYDFYSHDVADVCRAGNAEVFQSRQTVYTEELIPNAAGEPRWISITKTPKLDDHGNVEYVVCAGTDITDHKRAEEALRESKERYQSLYRMIRLMCDNVQDLIWAKDIEGRFLFVNRAQSEKILFAKDTEEPIGKTDIYFAERQRTKHPDRADWHTFGEICTDSDAIVMSTQKPERFDEFGNVNGQMLCLDVYKAPFFDEQGKMIGTVGCGRDVTRERQLQEEHKRAEDALRESEERHRSLIEHLPQRIFIKDRNSVYLSCNGNYASDLGLTPEQIVGKDDFAFHPAGLSEMFRADDQNCMSTGLVKDLEELYQLDGQKRWAHTIKVPYHDSQGQVIGVLGIFEDITERKMVERSLAESEERYRLLFKYMFEGLAYCKMVFEDGKPQDFIYLEVNDAFEELTGLKNVVGKKVSEVIPIIRESNPELFEIYGRVALTGNPEKVEIFLDSLGIWLSLSVYSPEREYFVAVFDNVTARKRAEEALRGSERRFRELAELLPQTVFEIDTAGRFSFVNSAALKLSGYSLDEFYTILNPVQLVIQEERQRVADNMMKLVAGQKVVLNPYTALRKGGSKVPILIYAAPICENGNIVGIRGVIVDISDLKQAEEEREKLRTLLFQSQKLEALGTLVGGIAHDFNNMLQIILGYSQLLLGDKKESDPSYKDLQTIIQTVQGGADLVNKLLAFGQQAPIFPVNLDLNYKIRELIPLLSRTLPQLVKIDLDLTHEPMTVHADPNQIDQIVMNLAINASEAMPDGGHLKIRTTTVMLDGEYYLAHTKIKLGKYVFLSLSDTGRGMDEKTLARIFEPFFSTKQRGSTRGTGLGMSVVQGIVEQQGGHITCESEPGKGSEFKIYFPAIQSEPTAEKKTSPSNQSAGIQTILVVEDNLPLLELAQNVLTNGGYSVIIATNGQEALDIYRRQKDQISLVILDLIMPEMSGRDCLMELVKIDPAVKVLIASGFSPSDELHKEINPLVKGFVHKPFGMIQLLDEVESALRDI